MEKELYATAEMEVIEFEVEDVIDPSDGSTVNTDTGLSDANPNEVGDDGDDVDPDADDGDNDNGN
jgi:hypothetical protein